MLIKWSLVRVPAVALMSSVKILICIATLIQERIGTCEDCRTTMLLYLPLPYIYACLLWIMHYGRNTPREMEMVHTCLQAYNSATMGNTNIVKRIEVFVYGAI